MSTTHAQKALSLGILLFVVAFALVPSVRADILAPGASGSPDDLFISVGATGVDSTGNLTLAFGGTVATNVFSDPDNEFCPGCLDFEFQVFNSSADTASITQIADSSFAGFQTDVGFNGNGEGGFGCFPVVLIGPSSVNRSSDGSTINFNFSPGVPQGVACTGTGILQIDTNATAFTSGTLTITSSSGDVETAATLAPTIVPTPEPPSLILLGSGLLGLAVSRRRASLRILEHGRPRGA